MLPLLLHVKQQVCLHIGFQELGNLTAYLCFESSALWRQSQTFWFCLLSWPPKKMAATQRFLYFDGVNDQISQTNRKTFMKLTFRPVEEKPAADTWSKMAEVHWHNTTSAVHHLPVEMLRSLSLGTKSAVKTTCAGEKWAGWHRPSQQTPIRSKIRWRMRLSQRLFTCCCTM